MRPTASFQRALYPRRAGPAPGLLALTLATVLLWPAAAGAQTARGQFRSARLPEPGEAWLSLTPAFESWNGQYALDSPLDSVADGTEEPLSADVDGPMTRRLHPGAAPFVAGLRQDAGALGYDSLSREAFSLGALDFDRFHANRRLVPFTVEVGLLERISARLTVPVVKSQTEAFFRYDSAGATFAPVTSVVSEPGAFARAWSTARDSLQARLDAESLSEEERARARALLEGSGAFLDAFSRRAEANLLFPLGGTRAGRSLSSRVDSLESAFQQFGLDVPGLDLSPTATAAALQSFFTGTMEADSLLGREHGWSVEGVELGLRLGLLDTFGSPSDTAEGGLQLRTSLGAALRLPRGSPGSAPFVTPASFLDVPVAHAQKDLEMTLYQDLGYGPLLLSARGRYGRQMPDELELRVHPPDRPFPVPSTSATVERDLGDYVEIHLAPRLRMNRAFSLGAEYTYWRKEADRYALASASGAGAPGDASPLAVESAERRHRLGVGIHYRAVGDSTTSGDHPVQLSFLFQAPVAGSGGQTPVSQLTALRIRIPMAAPSPGLPVP